MAEISEARFEELSRGSYNCKTEALIKCDLRLLIYAAIYEEGRPTNCIINIRKPWDVRIWWCLLGSHRDTVCGYWCPTVHFESIGKGPEFDLHHHHIQFDCHHYCWEAIIPGKDINPSDCSTPFIVAATVLYKTMCEKPAPILGFCKLPVVQFYDAD